MAMTIMTRPMTATMPSEIPVPPLPICLEAQGAHRSSDPRFADGGKIASPNR